MTTQVYAFAKVPDEKERIMVYQAIKEGKSRFGMWDQNDSLLRQHYGKNSFLLKIRKGDWIVHINSPTNGMCVAVQATGEYQYDEGIDCSWGRDFHNFIPVDTQTIVEFSRSDNNIVPSVNLSPMRRGQRISQVQDFLASLDNLKHNRISNQHDDSRGIIHLKEKISSELLPQITQNIHEMNKSKEFEHFLHRIFDAMPSTVFVKKNGFGWRTDHGADLIVEFQNPIIGIKLKTKLVIQAKSYEGDHFDLNAVDQIVQGIEKYQADGGLIITTANSTKELEEYIQKKEKEIGKPIDLIAGTEVAKFVIRYAPELLVGKE